MSQIKGDILFYPWGRVCAKAWRQGKTWNHSGTKSWSIRPKPIVSDEGDERELCRDSLGPNTKGLLGLV